MTHRPLRPNIFRIEAVADEIVVELNGARVSHLKNAQRNRIGYIGLQNHHEGSAVQFRRLEIMPIQQAAAAGTSRGSACS